LILIFFSESITSRVSVKSLRNSAVYSNCSS